MTPKGRETAAHHEAGLALVAGPRATADKVAKAQALPSQEVVGRATLLGIRSEHGSQGNVPTPKILKRPTC
jgi:ATP-dependent Zn protease